MSFARVKPTEAQKLLEADPSVTYVDVRSIPEWEQAHPKGSVNVPLMHLGPGGPSPNGEFLAVMEANFPKDAKLLVGCMGSGRSQRAAELLVQRGYTQVSQVVGGFGGERDSLGRTVVPGWAESGLPQGEGRPYSQLKR